MAGWETIVAAVGGAVLGFGIALAWQRRENVRLRRRLYSLRAEMRRSVLPVLEQRAVELAIPEEDSSSAEPADPTLVAVHLAERIRAHETRDSLPFSDTLDVSQDQLQRQARTSVRSAPPTTIGRPRAAKRASEEEEEE